MSPQSSIAHYRITSKLGQGGMGEVWRATDTKLGRDVAIKILPEAFAQDADRMARLTHEAQVLASLNHPNIAAIYGVEAGALVMELVEGSTLEERIRAMPMPLEETLRIAKQIAEALEAAHEKGIVHRDLKPPNIKITSNGVVKLLDFGLAKTEEAASSADSADSPTQTISTIRTGHVVGTAGYMAPEQAAGKPADKRADIWSYGVVLWEMLHRKRLFTGETVSHTLAHVLTESIDFDGVPPSTPPMVSNLLRRCLDRDVKTRLRDIGEARIVLQKCLGDSVAEARKPTSIKGPRLQRVWPWMALAGALTLLLAVAAISWWRAAQPATLRPLIRLSAELGTDMSLGRAGDGGMLALSPDGARLAVTLRGADGKVRLYTRLLHQREAMPLAGTENSRDPFFSPDGQWIGFFADGKLKKIAVDGGAMVTLSNAPNQRGASWGDDGNIIAALDPGGGLSRVSSAGGTPEPLPMLNPAGRSHLWPQVLPGAEAVVFTSHSNVGTGNYDNANIDVVSLKTGERKTLHSGGFSARYVATSAGGGYLVYLQQSTLFAAPLDLGRLSLTDAPRPVLEDVSSNSVAGGDFALATTGTLVYLPGQGAQNGWPISWLDRTGKTQPLHAPPGLYFTPRFSPDGKRLAFSSGNGAAADLWLKDLDRDTTTRLTFQPGENRWPVWTPDGRYIVFRSLKSGTRGLYWIRSDGSGEAIRLTDGQLGEYPYSFSPDGKRLAFTQHGNGGGPDIFTASIEGDAGHPRLGKPELFLGTPFTEVFPAFSPDGRWLAYTSNESGTHEVYVRPFPHAEGGRWQISAGGGTYPLWSHDGNELVFQTDDQHVMVVSYTAKGDSFTAGKPRLWSEARLANLNVPNYDLAPDGKGIAAVLAHDDSSKPLTHLTFLLNFSDEIQRRVPGRK
jgi:serine/threonine-protein kinase